MGRRKNSQPGWIVRLHFYSVIWLLNNGVTGLSPALRARLDSQVLCLPCLKAGFFCFLHYRYHCLYVQLFIFNFLCICLSLFGTLFFRVHPIGTFLWRLFTATIQTSTGAPHGFNRACKQLPWCPFPYLAFKTAHRATQGRVWIFSPKQAYPLPLKGEGRDFAHLWGFGFSLAVAFGNRWPQLAHTGPTGPVWGFGGVVSLPGSQNRTQGRTGASLALISFSWCA